MSSGKTQSNFSLSVENKGKIGEIKIFGFITSYIYDSNTANVNLKKFDEQLQELKNVDEIHLRINSNGGSVYEALGMYNSLKRFSQTNKIRTISYVEGLAASAASFLALAADKVVIGTGCRFMIHNPKGGTYGESKDMRKTADEMDEVKNSILDIYMSRCKRKREEISDLMDRETFFSANEAVEYGFADEKSSIEVNDLKNNLQNCWPETILNKYFPEMVFENKKDETKGGKEVTLTEFKNQHPNLEKEMREEIQNALKAQHAQEIVNAIAGERTRIKELEGIKPINQKQAAELAKAKFEEPKNKNDVIVAFYDQGAWKADEYVNRTGEKMEEQGFDNIITEGVEFNNAFDAVLNDMFGGGK